MAELGIWSFTAITLGIGFIYLKFYRAKYCRSKVSLKGKTVIVTGGNTGIGKETAVDLARRGARIILACRNPSKAAPAVREIRHRSGNDDVVFRQLDMANPDSIKTFAKNVLNEEARLDILVNNAGIAYGKPGVTVEGYDLIIWVNHFAPFLLTHLLLDRLKECAPSRIITLSSSSHSSIKSYTEFFYMHRKTAPPGTRILKTYGQSKVGNISFMRELAKRLHGSGVTTYSLHPGYVQTDVNWNNMKSAEAMRTKCFFLLVYFILWPFTMSPEAGAQTTIFCAVEDSITHLSGRYFTGCQLAKESDLARDDGFAKKLWDLSMQVTGLEH